MDKKLYEAIATIKIECLEHDSCEGCPFRKDGCVMDPMKDPKDWDIESLLRQEVEDNG